MKVTIPDFGTDKDQLYDWFKQNKSLLIQQKKMTVKEADSFNVNVEKDEYVRPDSNKEFGIIDVTTKNLVVKAAINTTGIIDSHTDLHLPKGWNRTVKHKENDGLHLKEHKMNFDNVLADGIKEVQVYVTKMSWKSLGYNYEGSCDVLMHKSVLKAYAEPLPHQITKAEMYYRYRDGEVKNHSVGMGYGELFFCVDSDEKYWKEEKENFDKYLEFAVNPEVAKDLGYYFAVAEMKYYEGSSVVRGSNWATPTVSVTEQKETEPAAISTSTTIDSSQDTQKQISIINKIKF